LPITKLDCANCHQQGQAANHCSHCHQYHQHGRPENKVNSRGVLAKEIEEFFSR
jgi:hypothetical protein